MNREQIQKLKLTTVQPPIFADFNTVDRLRAQADSIRAFGSSAYGWTPSDKMLIESYENQANRLEKELIVNLL